MGRVKLDRARLRYLESQAIAFACAKNMSDFYRLTWWDVADKLREMGGRCTT